MAMQAAVDTDAVARRVAEVCALDDEKARAAMYDLCGMAASVLLHPNADLWLPFAAKLSATQLPDSPQTTGRRASLGALQRLLQLAAEHWRSEGGPRPPSQDDKDALFSALRAALDRSHAWKWDLHPVAQAYASVLTFNDIGTIDLFRTECVYLLELMAKTQATQTDEEGRPLEPDIAQTRKEALLRLRNEVAVCADLAFCYLLQAEELREASSVASLLNEDAFRQQLTSSELLDGGEMPTDVTGEKAVFLRRLWLGGLLVGGKQGWQLRPDIRVALRDAARGATGEERPAFVRARKGARHLAGTDHGGRVSLVDDNKDSQRLADYYLKGY